MKEMKNLWTKFMHVEHISDNRRKSLEKTILNDLIANKPIMTPTEDTARTSALTIERRSPILTTTDKAAKILHIHSVQCETAGRRKIATVIPANSQTLLKA